MYNQKKGVDQVLDPVKHPMKCNGYLHSYQYVLKTVGHYKPKLNVHFSLLALLCCLYAPTEHFNLLNMHVLYFLTDGARRRLPSNNGSLSVKQKATAWTHTGEVKIPRKWNWWSSYSWVTQRSTVGKEALSACCFFCLQGLWQCVPPSEDDDYAL